MTPTDRFVDERSADWTELEMLVADPRPTGQEISRMAALYRSLCTDLVRARSAGVPVETLQHLDALAGRAHNRLYTGGRVRAGLATDLLLLRFPRTLRRNARFLALAAALFCLPLIVGLILGAAGPEAASVIAPRHALQGAADMYSDEITGRSESADTTMAGFYVYNNIGIAFRCFATGILFGLGSLFFLVYNGLVIGAVLGFVTASGFGHNILTFVCGHGPFELTAIVISGAAGLKMGWALGLTRVASLKRAGPELVTLVLGAASMLLVAAVIEGYWSPSGIPAPIKWGVSVLLSVLVAAWLIAGGRTERT